MMRMTKLAIALGAVAILAAAAQVPARAETVKLTILGVGDIYSFGGAKDRGGFARLNAVARAEKAANPNTIYVFDGDMFSPSLLSGFDKGAHTVELTNVVPFDIAVPGNHEFDFGTDTFLTNVKLAKYPWAALNITHADGSPIEGLGGTIVKEVAGLKVALVPVAQDTTPEVSSPGDWKFGNTVEAAIAGAKAARAAGADIVIGVIQADHSDDRAIMASQAFDVIMSGDDHDYMTGYDGITAYVETSTEAKYLDPLDLEVTITEKDGKRQISWEPTFRFIDTKTVTPDPETQKMVDGLKDKLDKSLNVEIGTTETPLELAAQCGAHRRSSDRRPDRRCHAGRQRGRHCHHQWWRHSRRQAVCRRHGAHPPRHPHRTALWQRHGGHRNHRPAAEGGTGERRQPG